MNNASVKNPVLAILTAMKSEMVGIERDFPAKSDDFFNNQGWRMQEGLDSKCFLSAVCGVKAERLGGLLEFLSSKTAVKSVLVLGCCGALSPDHAVGDPLIADSFIMEDTDEILPVDDHLYGAISKALPSADAGPFATVSISLDTIGQKSECRSNTGAITVEMEGGVIAKKARMLGLGVASARWVLDTHDEAIISNESENTNDKGRISINEMKTRLRVISDEISFFTAKLLKEIHKP